MGSLPDGFHHTVKRIDFQARPSMLVDQKDIRISYSVRILIEVPVLLKQEKSLFSTNKYK